MVEFFTVENFVALLTLTALEVVLGIDNIVVLAIITSRLDPSRRALARRVGLSLAMILRILLLLTIRWMMGLTSPLFEVFEHGFTGRDLILIGGGTFLFWKATHEIHEKLEGPAASTTVGRTAASFPTAIVQILILDLVFSLDSVITAVGMARSLPVMILAIIGAVLIMMACSGIIVSYIERHPTIKMLALSFLLLIGVLLVADGFGKHIERGYAYFAMAFSLGVELLNIRIRTSGNGGHTT
ncbi:MAG: TerC family protein [Candidatus Hydrogenedentes bacterium]|nr:TerC family protein [Candidatus Hydrogenedentota bacterium]